MRQLWSWDLNQSLFDSQFVLFPDMAQALMKPDIQRKCKRKERLAFLSQGLNKYLSTLTKLNQTP